ncbi:hypothetical protein P3342_002245 [Pyrenophora teres f. teres]|uniref:Uncharacterized protein n=1 Tax=Pyrenophora teres f. teres (strain 0-1) TaxID=861557 RepID=E3RG44_PYRTT|nr:hypothetical protein PTT_06741 [Pyrenophora teres f. teres 0-1]KAK1919951.1 hypothetical protein P3342_002245 [Pyrenophora teres f. teres]
MAFRFLDLAAEPRNRIYDFTVFSDEGIRPKHIPLSHDGNYATLTRVCRQISMEYLPLQRAAADVTFGYSAMHIANTYLFYLLL